MSRFGKAPTVKGGAAALPPPTDEQLAEAAPIAVPDMNAWEKPADTGTTDEGRVWVTKAGGTFDVAADDASKAFEQGYAPASSAEVDSALQREKLGTGAQQLRTAIERAAGTASFGASDYLASQFDPAMADEMRLRAQENPFAAGAGKVAGFLAPGAAAKAFKGVGVLGEAAELAAAPTEAMGAAGGFAERLAQGAVGTDATSVIGKALQSAVPAAARYGTEGAIIGAGDAVTEASLGPDHDLTAEKILAGAADGFGAGALLGGGLGAFGSVAGQAGNAAFEKVKRLVSPRDVEALAEREFGEAAPGLGDAWAKATAAASGKDIEAVRTLGVQNLTPEAREARRIAVYEGDAIRDEAKRAVRSQIDELNGATKNLSEEYMGGLKPGHVDASIAKGEEALGRQVEFAQGHLDAINTKVTEMLDDPAAYGQVADLKKLQRHMTVAEKALDIAADEKNGTQAFIALDDLKKRLGKLAKPGQFLSTSSDMAVSQEVRSLYDNLRQGLEDEGIWGKAGIDQQNINKAWSKYLDTKSLFEQRLSTQLGRDPNNPWVRNLTADPAKIDGYVNGLTSPKNDLVHQTIKDHLANSQSLAEALGTLSDLSPEKLAEIGKVFRSTEQFGKTISEAEKTLTLSNQLKALEAGDNGGFSSVTGALGGLAFGGPIGAALGAVGGVLTRPGQAVRQLAAIERLGTKVDADLAASVKAFGEKAVSVAGGAAKLGADAALRSAVGASVSDGEAHPANYHRAVADVNKAALSPDVVQARLARMTGGGLAHAAPNVSAAVTKKSLDALSYIQSKVPPAPLSSPLSPTVRRSEPSDAQMTEFMHIVRAAKDPRTVVADFKAGKLTPEAVQTMKTLSPGLHQQFVGMLTQKVGELAAKGKELPYAERIDLWMLTGTPVDGTFERTCIDSVQAMHQQKRGNPKGNEQNAPPQAPKRVINIADAHRTNLESLEANDV